MLAFISLFFPAAVCVWLFEALAKTEFSLKETVMRFCADALIINFLCLLVKKFIFGTGAAPLCENGDMTPNVAVVYITMSLVFGAIITVVQVIFFLFFTITVEEDSDEADKE